MADSIAQAAQAEALAEADAGTAQLAFEEMAQMPPVDPGVIDGVDHAPETAIPPDPEGGYYHANETAQVDSAGIPFDPSIHATGPDGMPSITPKGRFRRRRGTGNRSRSEHLDETTLGQSHQLAVMCTASLVTMCVALGGEEFTPVAAEGINERENLEAAFQAYIEAKGIDDIPPGIALAIAMSAYVIPRLAMPETKSRMARGYNWLKSKLARRRQRAKPEARHPREA